MVDRVVDGHLNNAEPCSIVDQLEMIQDVLDVVPGTVAGQVSAIGPRLHVAKVVRDPDAIEWRHLESLVEVIQILPGDRRVRGPEERSDDAHGELAIGLINLVHQLVKKLAKVDVNGPVQLVRVVLGDLRGDHVQARDDDDSFFNPGKLVQDRDPVLTGFDLEALDFWTFESTIVVEKVRISQEKQSSHVKLVDSDELM